MDLTVLHACLAVKVHSGSLADGLIAAEYNVYGESANIVSRLPPSSSIDTVVNEFVTTNLGVASTVLLADLLAAAERCPPPQAVYSNSKDFI